jgi:hypothetical protein
MLLMNDIFLNLLYCNVINRDHIANIMITDITNAKNPNNTFSFFRRNNRIELSMIEIIFEISNKLQRYEPDG